MPDSVIYVASAACGCVTAAIVASLCSVDDTANTVADFIRSGWLVDRHETAGLGRCDEHKTWNRAQWLDAVRADAKERKQARKEDA